MAERQMKNVLALKEGERIVRSAALGRSHFAGVVRKVEYLPDKPHYANVLVMTDAGRFMCGSTDGVVIER